MPNNLPMRARGVFLGAAVGDALGWPQEQNSGIIGGHRKQSPGRAAAFRPWERYAGAQFKRHIDVVPAGAYSDDTQLLIASARSILHGDWYKTLTTVELPQFLLYQRGAGGATLRSCRSWASGTPPWMASSSSSSQKMREQYLAAGGNGAAMRIAPHAVALVQESRAAVVSAAVLNGIATHGHPRALVGAAVYASAVHEMLTVPGTLEYGYLVEAVAADDAWRDPEVALSGVPMQWRKNVSQSAEFEAVWRRTVDEMSDLLAIAMRGLNAGSLTNDLEVLDRLGTFDRRSNGAGTVTAAGALYIAARTAPRPRGGLLRSAYLEHADADTLASMTGALLGALHGDEWLEPLGREVQDHDYLVQLASRCLDLSYGQAPTPVPARSVSDSEVRSFRAALGATGGRPKELPDGRSISRVRELPLPDSGKVSTRRWELFVEGQTLFVDLQREATSKAVHSSAASVGRVSIKTVDVDEVSSFYGEGGIGLGVERLSPLEILVDKSLRFVTVGSGEKASRGSLLIEVGVDDLDRIRVASSSVVEKANGSMTIIDPVGNEVRVTARGPRSAPGSSGSRAAI